jgi:nucleotide-binding universal stress UspA family protein
MKKLRFLIPIDFSASAKNAGAYAASLAQSTGSSIVFLHVIAPALDDDYLLSLDLGTIKTEAKRMLDTWTNQIRDKYQVDCEDRINVGDVTGEILLTAKDTKADFIIMGTHGAGAIKKLLYGSHTKAVIEKSACPVLAIPEGASFSPYERIVYATDYQSSDIDALSKLAQIAAAFEAEIDVVHIIDEHEHGATELSIIEYFKDLVTKHIQYPNITYRVLKHENVAKGIELFVQSVGGNMVALSMQKLGFLNKLFHASLTKELVARSRVPMMAFHVHEAPDAGGI